MCRGRYEEFGCTKRVGCECVRPVWRNVDVTNANDVGVGVNVCEEYAAGQNGGTPNVSVRRDPIGIDGS